MAARRPFWNWRRWKSKGFCLWPPSTCIWNLKLKFHSKLDLCSGNHVVYRQTDGRTDGGTRWIQYTSLGGGITKVNVHCMTILISHLLSIRVTPSWKMLDEQQRIQNTISHRKSYRKFMLPYFSVTCFKHVMQLWPISALDRTHVRGLIIGADK